MLLPQAGVAAAQPALQPAAAAQPAVQTTRTRVRKINCATCKPRCRNFSATECNQCNNCRRTEICDKVPKCKQFCVGNTVEEKTAACMATCNLGKERCATCNRECPDTAGR